MSFLLVKQVTVGFKHKKKKGFELNVIHARYDTRDSITEAMATYKALEI